MLPSVCCIQWRRAVINLNSISFHTCLYFFIFNWIYVRYAWPKTISLRNITTEMMNVISNNEKVYEIVSLWSQFVFVCFYFCHVEPLNRNRKHICRKCIIYWKNIYFDKTDSFVNLDHICSLLENLKIKTILNSEQFELSWFDIHRKSIPVVNINV